MFLQSPARIRSICSKIPIVDSFKANQGAIYLVASRTMSNEIGSGSGKGGGSGGSIRDAGGSMGRKGAAQEEQYFSKQSKDLKDKLKEHLKEEISKHESTIKATKEMLKEIEKEK